MGFGTSARRRTSVPLVCCSKKTKASRGDATLRLTTSCSCPWPCAPHEQTHAHRHRKTSTVSRWLLQVMQAFRGDIRWIGVIHADPPTDTQRHTIGPGPLRCREDRSERGRRASSRLSRGRRPVKESNLPAFAPLGRGRGVACALACYARATTAGAA